MMQRVPGAILRARYLLIGRVARGGQAEVWKATDLQSGVDVALKLLDPGAGAGEREVRLRQEAAFLMELAHPSMVRCLDLVQEPDYPFAVLEWFDGQPLSEVMRAPRFSEEHRRWVLLHLAHVLAFLHARGIVHRDVKPENVLVGRGFFDAPDRVDLVKLIDLGIAVRAGNPGGLTDDGARGPGEDEARRRVPVGTPEYLPPEALHHDFGPVGDGPRRDVFAFGVLAVRLFEHRHPTGLAEALPADVYRDKYLDFWDRPEALLSGTRPDLRPLTARCLTLHADRRAESMAALLADLPMPSAVHPPGHSHAQGPLSSSAITAPQPPSVAPPPEGDEAGALESPAWSWGARGAVAGLAALVLAGAGVLGYLLGQRWGGESEPEPATSGTSGPRSPRSRELRVVPFEELVTDASKALGGYPLKNAFDDNMETAYCEGEVHFGKGTWIELSTPAGTVATAIEVAGGWPHRSKEPAAQKKLDGDMWLLNKVATRMKITWENGETIVVFDPQADRERRPLIELEGGARKVRVEVEEVNKSLDAAGNWCVGELRLFTAAAK